MRDAQEAAIPSVLKDDRDVIVAAANYAGKIDAAFLHALTHTLEPDAGRLIVSISPLKALIHDQFGRFDRLCEQLSCRFGRGTVAGVRERAAVFGRGGPAISSDSMGDGDSLHADLR